jgi:hypothetical protein
MDYRTYRYYSWTFRQAIGSLILSAIDQRYGVKEIQVGDLACYGLRNRLYYRLHHIVTRRLPSFDCKLV